MENKIKSSTSTDFTLYYIYIYGRTIKTVCKLLWKTLDARVLGHAWLHVVENKTGKNIWKFTLCSTVVLEAKACVDLCILQPLIHFCSVLHLWKSKSNCLPKLPQPISAVH